MLDHQLVINNYSSARMTSSVLALSSDTDTEAANIRQRPFLSHLTLVYFVIEISAAGASPVTSQYLLVCAGT